MTCQQLAHMSAQPGPPYVPVGLVERISRTIGFLPLMIMGARIFGIPSVMPHQARSLALALSTSRDSSHRSRCMLTQPGAFGSLPHMYLQALTHCSDPASARSPCSMIA